MRAYLLKSELPRCIQETLDGSPIVLCEIGARRGGNRFYTLGPFVHYYGFEPDLKEAKDLEAKLRKNGVFQKVQIIPYAVMGQTGRVTMNVLRHRGCSSVLSPNSDIISRYALRHKPNGGTTTGWPRLFDVVGNYECDAMSLDEFSAKEKLPNLDFIGLDTQGTEYEILSGGKNIISKSTLLIHVEMEVTPLYRNQPLITDILRLLSDFGFRLARLENPQYVSRPPAGADDVSDSGELLSVDGIFCREVDERFLIGPGQMPIVVKYMLLLDSLGFRTFAIDLGRRFHERHPDESCVRDLTVFLEKRYRIDNYRLKPLKGKIREMAKNLYRRLVQ